MMLGGEVLVQEPVARHLCEGDRERLPRDALSRPRHRAGKPRIGFLTGRLRVTGRAVWCARLRLGGGQA